MGNKNRDFNEAMRNLATMSYQIKIAQPSFSPQFVGTIKPKGFPTSVQISQESWLLRASAISGTPWILGLVAYTGYDAKSSINLKVPPRKVSRIERLVN